MTRFTYRKSLFTVFKGYLDDSTHKDVFTFSALLARGTNWGWLSNDWKDCIDAKNRELIKAGRKPIKRYHASDCSNHYKDFQGWDSNETTEFTKELISLVTKPSILPTVFSFSLRLSQLVQVLPDTTPDPSAFANVLLLTCMMDEMSDWFLEANKGDLSMLQVALFHERGNYNATLQRAFDSERKRNAACKQLFLSLTPMGWEDCIPLQPADMLAYETCKEVERDKALRPNMRKALAAIIGHENFAGICKNFDKHGLERFRDWLTVDIKAQLLLDANLVHKAGV